MNRNFMEMFARQPDEIVQGDYFFRVAWYERDFAGHGSEEFFKRSEETEKESKENFLINWNRRTLDGEYNRKNTWMDWWRKCLKGQNKNAVVEEILQKIIEENIPFMDIASGEPMGLASYIMKQNPAIPCLVTDIQPGLIRRLRSCIEEYLPEYNISLASFDELDIPLKDNSIEYVTTICGIESSTSTRSFNSKDMSLGEYKSSCYKKLLEEVYRVLKPKGYFIAVEGEIVWDSDLQRINNYFKTHDKLFGLYTHDYVSSILRDFAEYKEKCSLSRRIFEEAGFFMEVKEHFGEKLSFDEVAQWLDFNGEKVHIETLTAEDDIIHLEMRCVLYILRKV